MSDPKYYLWLDLETTGLEVDLCDILEVAVILTDKDYNEIKRGHAYVLPLHNDWEDFPPLMESYLSFISEDEAHNFAYQMHMESGFLELWKKAVINDTALNLFNCENFLIDFVKDNIDMLEEPLIVLAGSSVHYDHQFIEPNFPEFNKLLHHRHHDLSAIKLFINSIENGVSDKFRNDVTPKHIAMNDLDSDLNWARNFRDYLIGLDIFNTEKGSSDGTLIE